MRPFLALKSEMITRNIFITFHSSRFPRGRELGDEIPAQSWLRAPFSGLHLRKASWLKDGLFCMVLYTTGIFRSRETGKHAFWTVHVVLQSLPLSDEKFQCSGTSCWIFCCVSCLYFLPVILARTFFQALDRKTTLLNQKKISYFASRLIFHRFSPFNCCFSVVL